MAQTYTLQVNGAAKSVSVEPDTPLLYILRNDLELNGPRFGCGLAQCGACTVLVDGKADALVRDAGCRRVGAKSITTLEGLGTRDKLHPLQKAFIEEQAAQCGYCTNGMIMAAKALLDKTPEADRRAGHARRWRRISAAAAPTTGSCAPCCARRRRRHDEHESIPVRRDFLKSAGAIVVGFSWGATGVLAQQAAAAPARQPQHQPHARRLDPHQRQRHRDRLHRQVRARPGHPDGARADRRPTSSTSPTSASRWSRPTRRARPTRADRRQPVGREQRHRAALRLRRGAPDPARRSPPRSSACRSRSSPCPTAR